jgi:zinc D-Ala-D-Ala dipeptidase
VSVRLLTALAVLAAARDGGSSEALVDAKTRVTGLVVELPYATEDNFLGRAVYPEGARCLLLPAVADRLASAARTLEAEGFRLKAWDCYRPMHVQWAMWKLVPRKGYVADPHTGSNHNRGAAVDVTLVTLDGLPVEMPTPFDTFGPAAHHGSSAGTAEARAHRETLRQAMAQAGFRPNRMEWWHYDAPERRGAPLLDMALVPAP